jgi:CheY-like chemotaxis protein
MDTIQLLIVDDNQNLARLVQLILEKTRLYLVAIENRSRNALAAAQSFRPKLILLDVDMPGMDGGDVARQLRADPELRDTPIVFFTSLISSDESGQKFVSRGGEFFLAKPVDPQVLIHCVGEILNGAVANV